MNQPHDDDPPAGSAWPTGDEPPEHVKDVLRRTVDFLSRCSEDPRAAMENEDPAELIADLENLVEEPANDAPAQPDAEQAPEDDSPPSIHRRRRSA
jgi:hypothetical protein